MLAISFTEIFASPVLLAAVVIGLYMAWNIGANDVANAMGTSVGSKALTFGQAVVLAGIFEFFGAVFVGQTVTDTVRSRVVDASQFEAHPNLFAYGMLAALVSAAVWLNVATYFGQPVSTTHSIIGGVFGFGVIAGGSIKWGTMGQIVASWFVSPVVSGLISFLMFRFLLRAVLTRHEPDRAAKRLAPPIVFFVAFIIVLSLFYKVLKGVKLDAYLKDSMLERLVTETFVGQYVTLQGLATIGVALLVGLVASVIGWLFVLRISNRVLVAPAERLAFAERVFAVLQICTACYVAFSHGANDVANAVGPMAAVYLAITQNSVTGDVNEPWLLYVGAVGIVIGLAMMGRRVIETVGSKITEVTPTRGFCAEFAAATTVLVASLAGMPISTTHSLVGAVMGVALARGISALETRVVWRICASWIATVPITAIMTMILYGVFRLVLPS